MMEMDCLALPHVRGLFGIFGTYFHVVVDVWLLPRVTRAKEGGIKHYLMKRLLLRTLGACTCYHLECFCTCFHGLLHRRGPRGGQTLDPRVIFATFGCLHMPWGGSATLEGPLEARFWRFIILYSSWLERLPSLEIIWWIHYTCGLDHLFLYRILMK